MDLDTVAQELYGLRPDEFTRTRNERVSQARALGQRDVANRIGQLRKPTTSAWVVNLLVREDATTIETLLRLGQQLRDAQAELDSEQMRALSQQRSQVVSALARQGRRLAREAGHPVSESVGREVESCLQAALADPDAAASVGSGRLTAALSHSGLGPVGSAPGAPGAAGGSGGSPGRASGTSAGQAGRPGGEAGAGTGHEAARKEARRAEIERAEIDQAEQSLSEAREIARQREEEHERVRAQEEEARSRKEAADERVAQLEADLRAARDGAASVAEEVKQTSRRRQKAGRDLAAAERRVEQARHRLDRLRGE